MPNNYLSVLYKYIIQVENKNVGLKVGAQRYHCPPPPNKKRWVTCPHVGRLRISFANIFPEGLYYCYNLLAKGIELFLAPASAPRLVYQRPCYPVCGMVHIKEPLLLIDKSSLCGGSGFPFSLSEWSLTICLTPYNRR